MKLESQRVGLTEGGAGRHRRPGWVWAVVAVAVIVAAIVVTAALVSGTDHGPARHQPAQPVETPADHGAPVEDG